MVSYQIQPSFFNISNRYNEIVNNKTKQFVDLQVGLIYHCLENTGQGYKTARYMQVPVQYSIFSPGI